MNDVSENEQQDGGETAPARNPNRIYIIIAAVLLVVIIVALVLLITQGLPALRGEKEPTATSLQVPTSTPVPTFTPRPTPEATSTPLPVQVPTTPVLTMSDTSTPLFDLEGAGGRPSLEWTGFFGQVVDAAGTPMEGISVIVWYRDGQPASNAVQTAKDGTYEIRLADAPLEGTWTIQVLNADGTPASKLLSFQTDTNTETGIQQIQANWKRIP